MSTTTVPDDKSVIINEFIADPDASAILRQVLREFLEDSARPVTDDSHDMQVESAKSDSVMPELRTPRKRPPK